VPKHNGKRVSSTVTWLDGDKEKKARVSIEFDVFSPEVTPLGARVTRALGTTLDNALDTLYNSLRDRTVAPAHETWTQLPLF